MHSCLEITVPRAMRKDLQRVTLIELRSSWRLCTINFVLFFTFTCGRRFVKLVFEHDPRSNVLCLSHCGWQEGQSLRVRLAERDQGDRISELKVPPLSRVFQSMKQGHMVDEPSRPPRKEIDLNQARRYLRRLMMGRSKKCREMTQMMVVTMQVTAPRNIQGPVAPAG